MDRERENVTDLHVVVDFEFLCDDVGAVELLINDAAADRITVQTDKHVKESCTVKDDQFLVAVDGA